MLLVILLERSFRVLEVRWPRLVERLPGYAVGTLGAYWTIQRTLILLRGMRDEDGGDAASRRAAARGARRWPRTLWPALAWAHVEGGPRRRLPRGPRTIPSRASTTCWRWSSVGLWGAQLGAPAVWLLPVTFPMVMAFGGMLGLLGVPLPGVEVGIALSGILLGLAVLAEWRPPLVVGRRDRRLLRHLPRPRPRHGAARGRERPALQHRLRGGDGHAPRHRHRDRRDPPLGLGRGWRCAWRARSWPRPGPISSGGPSHDAARSIRRALRTGGDSAAAAGAPRTPTSSTPASAPSTTASRTSRSRRRTCCRRSRSRSSPASAARARGDSRSSPCPPPGSRAASPASPSRRSARATALTTSRSSRSAALVADGSAPAARSG